MMVYLVVTYCRINSSIVSEKVFCIHLHLTRYGWGGYWSDWKEGICRLHKDTSLLHALKVSYNKISPIITSVSTWTKFRSPEDGGSLFVQNAWRNTILHLGRPTFLRTFLHPMWWAGSQSARRRITIRVIDLPKRLNRCVFLWYIRNWQTWPRAAYYNLAGHGFDTCVLHDVKLLSFP
jgi:hypothetical protein